MKRNILIVVLLLMVLVMAGGYAVSFVSADTQPNVAPVTNGSAAPRFSTVSDMEAVLANLYTQVNPSVVSLEVVQQATTNPSSRFGQRQQPVERAVGSGFVWDTTGNIVTNNHVVAGATQIAVVFYDGTTVTGKVIGTDPNSDLAVVKVDAPANQLRPVQIADSTQVKVGQLAIAIGNPFGEQNTMTTGIISALGRSIPVNASVLSGASYSIPDVIQTDAPINPGNSGGVLLNAQGQVVGVTAAIESSSGVSAGIGFAIPSVIVQKVVPALIKNGRYDHPYLGVSGTSLTPTLAQAMSLKADRRGALVLEVVPNGPASKAGLRGGSRQTTVDGAAATVGGDVIVAMDGQTIKKFDDVIAYLARSTQVNQTVTLTILRDGKEQTLKLTLGARPNTQTLRNDSGNAAVRLAMPLGIAQ